MRRNDKFPLRDERKRKYCLESKLASERAVGRATAASHERGAKIAQQVFVAANAQRVRRVPRDRKP